MIEARVSRILKNVRRSPEALRCIATSSDWRWMLPGYLGVRDVRFPVEFRTRRGDAITLETFHDLITAWVIFFRREYRVEPTDRVIIDAGANIGVFSTFAARLAPHARIIALEPFPATFAKLSKTLARNGLEARVRSRQIALAASNAARMMDDRIGPSQSRGMFADGAVAGVRVEASSLASFLEEEGLEEIDLLKIDIEGGEHEVFAGTPDPVLRRIRRIALEYHPNRPKSRLFERLARAGFRLNFDLPAGVDSGVAELIRISGRRD